MSNRLVHDGWGLELSRMLIADHSIVCVVSPFIKLRAAKRLIEHGAPDKLQVITRFQLANFAQGVSDLAALRLLIEHGARIRGIKRLHSKLYLAGRTAIVTSANLTEAGMTSNYELGVVRQGAASVRECREYFKRLWLLAEPDLTTSRLREFEKRVDERLRALGTGDRYLDLSDEGADGDPGDAGAAGRAPPGAPINGWYREPPASFVKFFGRNLERVPHSTNVRDEIGRSGCHSVCAYPAGKRPRSVPGGSTMFMGRLVRNPTDTLIFGRGVGIAYEPGLDDATAEDIELRDWRENWSRYIRVHDAQFVAGSLSNGVSLRQLMSELGPASFASTKANLARSHGNTDPRRAYPRHPHVRLSDEGRDWLTDRLEQAFAVSGMEEDLERIEP